MIKEVLFGPSHPAIPNLRVARYDDLFVDGLTMGTIFLGKQGSGKTSSLARHLVTYAKSYPNRAIFVLDWSGSITDTILSLILAEPPDQQENILSRVVYDEPGNPTWVIPLPEFSTAYGPVEEQVQRVANNLVQLAPQLVQYAPVLGGLALNETAPNLFRLLTAVPADPSGSWQITEAKQLLTDHVLLKLAIKLYGDRVPEARRYLVDEFTNREVTVRERELRTFTLRALLGTVEPDLIRARLGYPLPGWTPKEAITKGQIVLVNGSNLINQKKAQHYLFTQIFSLIMAEINHRRPNDPYDQPVALVMDEVYSLLQIPGMAREVGMIAPVYRSRKLELYLVIQALWQLAENLRKQIWSLGNVVCFAIQDVEEAYEIAQQLFPYNPATIKFPARSETGQPVIEGDRGQYLTAANWIQGLSNRECLVRRYYSERKQDPFVRFIPRTRNVTDSPSPAQIAFLKEQFLHDHGFLVKEVLNKINQRSLSDEIIAIRPPRL